MLRELREFLQWRRGDAIILGEANVLPETDMEYFGDDGDRMHMMFNFQVNQNLFYALAAADSPPARQGAGGDQAAARDRAMGPVPAQPRRARPRPPDAEEQRQRGVRRASAPEPEHAALRPRHPPPARADAAGRPAAPRAGLQPDVHAARHAGAALRRRDRHGRRPATARAQLRAHADAVVDRAARRLHQGGQAGAAGDQRAARTAIEHVNVAEQRRDPELAAQLDGAHHPHAQGGPRDRLGRLRGAADARPRGPRDALRLAQQLGAVRAQPRSDSPREIDLRRRAWRGRQAGCW